MPDPFPSVPLQSEFVGTGIEENPLSEGGSWGVYDRPPLRKAAAGGALPSQEFVVNGSYWTRNVFLQTCEAFCCPTGGGLGAALESWRLVFWLTTPTVNNGYMSAYGGGIGQDYFFRRYDGGSFTGIGDYAGGAPGPNKIGIRITPDRVEQWAFYSGAWNLISTALDTTHRGVFYVALECEEQGGINDLGFGCFGVGQINRQHIYRVLRG
jgi:hypothetical protein